MCCAVCNLCCVCVNRCSWCESIRLAGFVAARVCVCVRVCAHFSVLPWLELCECIQWSLLSISIVSHSQTHKQTQMVLHGPDFCPRENNDCIICSMRQKYWMCILNLFSLLSLYTFFFCPLYFFFWFHSILFVRPFDEFVAHFWGFLLGIVAHSGCFIRCIFQFFFCWMLLLFEKPFSIQCTHTRIYCQFPQQMCVRVCLCVFSI